MFSGKLSQCISEPCFSASSDKKTADLAFWGAVSCVLCSCCSCQGLAKLQTATWPKQELPVLPSEGSTSLVAVGSAHELLGQMSFGPWGCCPLDPALGGTSTKTWEGAVTASAVPGHSSHLSIWWSRTARGDGWSLCSLEGLLRGGNAAPHCSVLSFFSPGKTLG